MQHLDDLKMHVHGKNLRESASLRFIDVWVDEYISFFYFEWLMMILLNVWPREFFRRKDLHMFISCSSFVWKYVNLFLRYKKNRSFCKSARSSKKTLQAHKNRTWIPLISNPCCGGSPLCNLRSFCGNLGAFCGHFKGFHLWPKKTSVFNILKKCLFHLKCSFHQKTLRNSCSFLWFGGKNATIEGSGIFINLCDVKHVLRHVVFPSGGY